MTAKNTFSIPPYKRIAAFGLVAAGLCLGIGGYILLHKYSPPQKQDFVALEGLPENTAIEALLETPGRHADILPISHKTGFSRPASQQAGVITPYRISASLKMPWGDYRDFTLNIGKDKKTFSILADGFSSYDEITMTLDGRAVYKNVPMDWSGRLELKADLPQDKSVNACIRVNGREQSIGLCHMIEAGKPA